MLFRVFELQNQTLDLSWLELDSLGSRALFLARCSSRAFELPANSEIKPGSIFFLNDITFGESVAATKNDNQYNRNDMGVYYKDEPCHSPWAVWAGPNVRHCSSSTVLPSLVTYRNGRNQRRTKLNSRSREASNSGSILLRETRTKAQESRCGILNV